jgi:RNA polymerase sigma-70 factor (ECF subfamily)
MPHESPGAPEPSLIRRAIHGDTEAFGALYDRYLDEIHRYIFFQVSGTGLAEDLTETVFLKAFESLPGFRSGRKMTHFRAWLYRIARNTVIDHYRTKKAPLPLDEQPPMEAPEPGPEGILQTKETRADLHQAIDQLDDPFRQVILMRFISDLSYEETAGALELTVNYVRVIQFRALRKLKAILDVSERRTQG